MSLYWICVLRAPTACLQLTWYGSGVTIYYTIIYSSILSFHQSQWSNQNPHLSNDRCFTLLLFRSIDRCPLGFQSGVKNMRTTEFFQGRTVRWGLAWSFTSEGMVGHKVGAGHGFVVELDWKVLKGKSSITGGESWVSWTKLFRNSNCSVCVHVDMRRV